MNSTDTYDNAASTGSGFFLGVLCGTAIGAALALLLTPKSGPEMRQTLRSSADRFRRQAGETYSDASEAVSDLVDKGRAVVKRGREKIESTIEGSLSSIPPSSIPRSAN